MRRPHAKSVIFLAAVAMLAFLGPSLFFAFRFVYEIQSVTREQRKRIESANLPEIRTEADRLLSQYDDLEVHEDICVDLSTVGDYIRHLQPTYVAVSPGKVRIECQGGFHHIGLMVFAASSYAPPSDGCRELIDRVWLYEDTE
jgi:hypothetical protein